ncbi:hypothetical protein BVY02_02725 [bacterium J17]|nr:hypothetical protein BVY02_02725 [bacterium J17]
MVLGNSRKVSSNQIGLHLSLEEVVLRHIRHESRTPIAGHSQKAFEESLGLIVENREKLVLDSGCGTGESTISIAKQFPELFVIGFDKSLSRLSSFEQKTDAVERPSNLHLIRADAVHFWRLLKEKNIKLQKHYLLYPNPWPKKKHLQRRWHGSSSLPDILSLGGKLELKSNWKLYLEEFKRACEIASTIQEYSQMLVGEIERIEPGEQGFPISLFEKKYHESGQDLYKLTIELA